ncbi:hypothetical protein M2092_001907 [Fusobacterium sp. PH5-44]
MIDYVYRRCMMIGPIIISIGVAVTTIGKIIGEE